MRHQLAALFAVCEDLRQRNGQLAAALGNNAPAQPSGHTLAHYCRKLIEAAEHYINQPTAENLDALTYAHNAIKTYGAL